MKGRSQMQEDKNWIFLKEINADRFYRGSHWLEIWKNHYGTEWREHGYGLGLVRVKPKKPRCRNERFVLYTQFYHQYDIM
jgi:hypothetical protein